MRLKLMSIVVLVGFAIVFALQNVAVVEIQFLFWSLKMSRALLVPILVVIGIVIGWFLHSYTSHLKNNSGRSKNV